MTTSYKVGDILLCHKHIGVAKFVGKLHGNDYQQLSSKSQSHIKPSEIWVGLQLAEEPIMNKLSLMKPHRKHSKSLKAISYQCFNAIPYRDYFSAHYGLLIPYKYIHKKINAYQILTKLTELFHALKNIQKHNLKLTKNIKKLQSEIKTTKKVKSTSQQSLESIIYDKNGNLRSKITHTTTHSYKSSHTRYTDDNDNDNNNDNDNDNDNNDNNDDNNNNDNDNDHDDETKEDDSTILSIDSNNLNLNLNKQRDSEKVIVDNKDDKKSNNDNNNNNDDKKSNDLSDDTNECASNSLSEKATDGVVDNHSDRGMSDCDEHEVVIDEPPINTINTTTNTTKKQQQTMPRPALTDLLSHHTFNPERDIIKEEKEEEYNDGIMHSNNSENDDINTCRPPFHARRYSAPYNNKKLSAQEFGSDYAKLHDPYWKISGDRTLLHTIPSNDSINDDDDDDDNHLNDRNNYNQSTEINMLPMIKEDPTTIRIYRLSRLTKNQQNNREKHKRSMSVVNVPRYFFEIDYEYPDLPDL